MQLPERRPHRLARHFLPPLVEHPDDPVLRLLVVLGPHASFSPFAWKESLYQSQGSSRCSTTSPAHEPPEMHKPWQPPTQPRRRTTSTPSPSTRAWRRARSGDAPKRTYRLPEPGSFTPPARFRRRCSPPSSSSTRSTGPSRRTRSGLAALGVVESSALPPVGPSPARPLRRSSLRRSEIRTKCSSPRRSRRIWSASKERRPAAGAAHALSSGTEIHRQAEDV